MEQNEGVQGVLDRDKLIENTIATFPKSLKKEVLKFLLQEITVEELASVLFEYFRDMDETDCAPLTREQKISFFLKKIQSYHQLDFLRF